MLNSESSFKLYGGVTKKNNLPQLSSDHNKNFSNVRAETLTNFKKLRRLMDKSYLELKNNSTYDENAKIKN